MPTSHVIGLISSSALPSILTPVETTLTLTRFLIISSNAVLHLASRCSSASNSFCIFSYTSSNILSISSCLFFFSFISTALFSLSIARLSILFTMASGTSTGLYSLLAFPAWLISSSWISISLSILFFPNIIASTISSSLSSSAPASIILMASFVPATTRFRDDSFNLSIGRKVSNLFSVLDTLTPATGPKKGISDKARAQDAAIMLIIAGSLSWSALIVVMIT